MTENKRFDIILFDTNRNSVLIDRKGELIAVPLAFNRDILTEEEKGRLYEWLDLLNENEELKQLITDLKGSLDESNEIIGELKKEYYQMRDLYFENTEDICDNCKHRYLVEVKDMQGYYHQKCKKGYSECPKGTVTYCGDFELKGDVE